MLPSGGSIPFVSTLAAARSIDVALLGFGLPDDATHAPNERLTCRTCSAERMRASSFTGNWATDSSGSPASRPRRTG